MTDIVDTATRSKMMSGIRGKDTRLEQTVRKLLFARGYRYRLHSTKLAGKPDIVLSKYKSVIFVSGCFWHGHNCHLFKVPQTRTEFWTEKINANKIRDHNNTRLLEQQGWRVLTVWECAIKGSRRLPEEEIAMRISAWLTGAVACTEIEGKTDGTR